MQKQNQYYWNEKENRATIAKNHTQIIQQEYAKEIADSIKNTHYYDENWSFNKKGSAKGSLSIDVVPYDTVRAILGTGEEKTAALNFASYKHPGGCFLGGSRAQEECLCHESFLYNVLANFEDSYYKNNQKKLNGGLYMDRALYSPGILFKRHDEQKWCDVITCAAPNFHAASYRKPTRDDLLNKNNEILRQRIRFVLQVAKAEGVKTLILGAWGCGVFQQNPKTVAKYFVEECENILGDTDIHVIFAVIPPLPKQTDNFSPFVDIVNAWKQKNTNSI